MSMQVTMMVMCLPAAAGWLLLALAPSVPLLVLGRLLTGTAGAFSMLAPAFVGEVAEVSVRGGLSSIMQVIRIM
jgi:SP family facilitated glucose transporter-like MFS transporter 8